MRQIEDPRTVIKELGGTAAVAELTGVRSHKTIYNWIANDQFPSWLYPIVQDGLKQRGCVAAKTCFNWQRKRKGGNGPAT